MSAAPKAPILVNAEAMALTYSGTFKIPPEKKRFGLEPEDHAQISTGGERFWVVVEKVVSPGAYVGRVENDLVASAIHHLKVGDAVKFSAHNIYKIE